MVPRGIFPLVSGPGDKRAVVEKATAASPRDLPKEEDQQYQTLE